MKIETKVFNNQGEAKQRFIKNRCKAITHQGIQCNNKATIGDYCTVHACKKYEVDRNNGKKT